MWTLIELGPHCICICSTVSLRVIDTAASILGYVTCLSLIDWYRQVQRKKINFIEFHVVMQTAVIMAHGHKSRDYQSRLPLLLHILGSSYWQATRLASHLVLPCVQLHSTSARNASYFRLHCVTHILYHSKAIHFFYPIQKKPSQYM